MNIKEELKITHTTYGDGQEAIRLNMPVRKLFDAVGATHFDFFEKLEAHGIELDAPIMASEQDVADYIEVDAKYSEISRFDLPPSAEEDYYHGLVNVLLNLVYFDCETTDEATGKHGLAYSNGKVIVPARFDSCEGCDNIRDYDNLAIVSKGGKYYLTLRDGSGRLLNGVPYDSIRVADGYGWVECGDKCGLVNIKNSLTIIPCEMDWMESVSPYKIVFGRNHFIGFYDVLNEKQYISPRFDAFDFTTKQFSCNGEWGWLRQSGRFTKVAPKFIYNILMLGSDAASILDYHDKPREEGEKEYYTIEEMEAEFKDKFAKMDAIRKRPLKSFLELPPLEIPEDVKPHEKLLAMINRTIDQCLNRECYDLTISVEAPAEPDAPIVCVNFRRIKREVYMSVIWLPRNKKTAWRDVLFDATASFHQIAEYGNEGLRLRFERLFGLDEAETVARFVSYYFSQVWNVANADLQLVREVPAEYVTADGETEFGILPLDENDNIIAPEGCTVPMPNCQSAEQVLEDMEDFINGLKTKNQK